MPIRWQIDRGFTIAANETQYWWWNWFSDAGSGSGQGPNKGPVIFRASPKGPAQGGNNTAKNVLVTYDFAKCRGGPGDDHAQSGEAAYFAAAKRGHSSICTRAIS